ncbi:MAG: hypothetical protein Q8P06_00440 [Candidatus Azambacteria bacterium]|nr:hypothetical protein [Candidatus Azambacteria bacterium]
MTYKFSVKKPVHSFRDLEVYQRMMEASVAVVKNLKAKLTQLRYPFVEGMTQCSMSIPLFIGEAHSIRFGDHPRGILLLEKAMADCNKMIIYLEQARGIYGSKLDFDLIEDLIKKYADTRTKIFRLERAWQKFTPPQK